MIRMIVCCDMMGNIGKDNDLLFHIPQDMAFFKQQTTGKCVLMGYNTYLSLGSKPLPKRKNIVLAEKEKHHLIQPHDNLIVTDNLDGIIGECLGNGEEVFIIGGAFVYNDTLSKDMIDEALITFVPTVVENADVSIHIELLAQRFRHAEKIKDFIDEKLNKTVSIWRFSKH